MKRRSLAKNLVFAVVPALCALVLIATGYFLGSVLAIRPIRTAIDVYGPYEHLTGFNRPEHLRDLAECYYDPEKAFEGFRDFIWAPFTVPTPFVGTAPMPGGEINIQGFRYATDLKVPKPSNVFRIFLVGGSTAFGSGAPDSFRTIAGYLEAELENRARPSDPIDFQVVTAANPAWASAHERILIDLRLPEFQPDLVISFSGANDIFWGFRGRNVNWFRTQTEEYYWRLSKLSFSLVGDRNLVDPVLPGTETINPETVADRLRKNALSAGAGLQSSDVPYIYSLQPSVSVTAKKLSQSEQRNIERVERLENAFEFERACYQSIRDRFSAPAQSLWFLDLSQVFDKVPRETSIFLDNVHLGDRGNQLVAKALAEELLAFIPVRMETEN